MTDYLTTELGFGADDSPRSSYTLRVNGVDRPVADAWIGESLLYVLRERLGLAGAKGGCEQGECGACSVQVDGQLTAACLVPAALAAGVEVRTVEGLAEEGVPSDVQQALADSGAVQCGYCAPGLAMAVHDLLERNHHPSELEARQALCGNLCRCTGYRGALAAVQAVAATRAEDEESPEGDATPAAPVGYFGEGPAVEVGSPDELVEAAPPFEEPVPAGALAHGTHFDELDQLDPLGEPAQVEDDGYDMDAELPVYVDVPPQHGGYDDAGGYGGAAEPGYPQQESYPQQNYATGTYGQTYAQPPYEQPHGEGGPYPGGPFGGRFPSQSVGHDAATGATAEAAGTLLTTDDTTGQFDTGQFATGQFETGQFATGEFATGQFETGQFATGQFETGQFATGEFATAGWSAPNRSAGEQPQQDYADYAGPADAPAMVPGQGGGGATQTGELRLNGGLGAAGLGAGMRAQVAARRLSGGAGGAAGAAGQVEQPQPAAAAAATAAPAPMAFGGAATSAAGLPSDVTGSFHIGTLSVPAPADIAVDQPYDDGGGFDSPDMAGMPGMPGGLDPATGVYVLPHQHGQETGS